MQLLRAKQVAEKLACVEDNVWAIARKDSTFPKPFRLGPRHTAWAEEEIDVWLLKKREGRDANTNQ